MTNDKSEVCPLMPATQPIPNTRLAFSVVCSPSSANVMPRTSARHRAVCSTSAGSFGRWPRLG